MVMPARIINRANGLRGDEKFGSIRGVQKPQFARAPPIIAIMVKAIMLSVCVKFSEEYWGGGLKDGASKTYIEKRVE